MSKPFLVRTGHVSQNYYHLKAEKLFHYLDILRYLFGYFTFYGNSSQTFRDPNVVHYSKSKTDLIF